jgi:hypothetical protein
MRRKNEINIQTIFRVVLALPVHIFTTGFQSAAVGKRCSFVICHFKAEAAFKDL